MGIISDHNPLHKNKHDLLVELGSKLTSLIILCQSREDSIYRVYREREPTKGHRKCNARKWWGRMQRYQGEGEGGGGEKERGGGGGGKERELERGEGRGGGGKEREGGGKGENRRGEGI